MAFNFPSMPVQDQTFTPPVAGAPTYIYRTPAWELLASASVVGLTLINDAPPAGVSPGQTWWEADTGIFYVWYNDGDSSQWVQANGGGGDASLLALIASLQARIAALEAGG